jgi:hypothetical protein
MDFDERYEFYKEPDECNYDYWMKHDLLTIVQISFIASGYEPVHFSLFFACQDLYKKQSEIFELLLNAIEANKIKATSLDNFAKAPPFDWLRYLKSKNYSLPIVLDDMLMDEVIHATGNQEAVKRSKDSYQSRETRGDEPVLKAVMRTLLDLFPEYPKDRLIELAPIRLYANGSFHSSETLKQMITEIEGGKRLSGRPSSNKIEKINREIPEQWLKKK